MPGTLLVTWIVPKRLPSVFGVNITEIVQLLLAGIGAAVQFEVTLNSLVRLATEETTSGAVPLLVRVKVRGPEVAPSRVCGKTRVPAVVKLAMPKPLPLKGIVCGLPEALEVMVRVALRAPATLGVNHKVMVQVALTARSAGQSLKVPKSPPAVTLEICRVRLPLLVTTTVW